MKRALLTGAVVGVVILALGVAGFAYAQSQTPEAQGTYPYGPAMMDGAGFSRGAMGRGFGPGMMGQGAYGEGEGLLHDYMQPAIAEAFGLTIEELEALHESGDTLWDYAQEQGMSQEEFFSTMQAARTAALNQAVADEVITQEQADWMLSHMGQGFGQGNGECPHEFGTGGGFGMRGGRGGWNNQP